MSCNEKLTLYEWVLCDYSLLSSALAELTKVYFLKMSYFWASSHHKHNFKKHQYIQDITDSINTVISQITILSLQTLSQFPHLSIQISWLGHYQGWLNWGPGNWTWRTRYIFIFTGIVLEMNFSVFEMLNVWCQWKVSVIPQCSFVAVTSGRQSLLREKCIPHW